MMPYKDQEKRRAHHRAYMKERYKNNKEHREQQKKLVSDRKSRSMDWLVEYKSGKSCIQCGESDPVCLDFHHIDPSTKSFSVTRMPSKGQSIQRILEEIAKCEILCANCHRKKHAKRWKRYMAT